MPDEAISVATLATSTFAFVGKGGLEAGRFWPLAFHAVIDSFSRAIISCGTNKVRRGRGSKQVMVYKRLSRVGRCGGHGYQPVCGGRGHWHHWRRVGVFMPFKWMNMIDVTNLRYPLCYIT